MRAPTPTLSAAGGSTDSDADVNLNTRAKVEGHYGSLLRTAELEVNALQNNFSSDASARRSGAWIDVGGRSESDDPKNARREIYWDRHVIMLGEPNPELEVDKDGKIVKMTNVTLATGETLGQTIAGPQIICQRHHLRRGRQGHLLCERRDRSADPARSGATPACSKSSTRGITCA
jgi:hypothetical protein